MAPPLFPAELLMKEVFKVERENFNRLIAPPSCKAMLFLKIEFVI